jgi:hypothetical protein
MRDYAVDGGDPPWPGRYRPGVIRRALIPKAGGGQSGLGMPNVVDRVVQERAILRSMADVSTL